MLDLILARRPSLWRDGLPDPRVVSEEENAGFILRAHEGNYGARKHLSYARNPTCRDFVHLECIEGSLFMLTKRLQTIGRRKYICTVEGIAATAGFSLFARIGLRGGY